MKSFGLKNFKRSLLANVLAICGIAATSVGEAATYKHVMLISIDGMHALDLSNYVAANPTSTLAALFQTGVFYPNALSPNPSDSFPGFAAQVTGGSPKSTGVFYDDSYDRTFFAPASECKGTPGTEVEFANNIDVDSKQLNAAGTPGDYKSQIRSQETADEISLWQM